MKGAFKMKQKTFVIICKGLLLKQIKIIFFEGESPTLMQCKFFSSKAAVHHCSLKKLVWKSSEIHTTAVEFLFVNLQIWCLQLHQSKTASQILQHFSE